MNRNVLIAVIGVLTVVTVFLGYRLYEERRQEATIGISIGDQQVSIEKK